MARTATKTASILSDLYEETFANDSYEPFRISWSDLRGIAGVAKLYPGYLRNINQALNEPGYTLLQFDNFLLVTQESNLSHIRLVPPRIVEQYRYEESDDLELTDEDEDAGVENPEDCEIDDDDVESA
jgi:hypothetical protein